MRLIDYLRDRLPALIIGGVTYGLALLFMAAYRLSGEAGILLSLFNH